MSTPTSPAQPGLRSRLRLPDDMGFYLKLALPALADVAGFHMVLQAAFNDSPILLFGLAVALSVVVLLIAHRVGHQWSLRDCRDPRANAAELIGGVVALIGIAAVGFWFRYNTPTSFGGTSLAADGAGFGGTDTSADTALTEAHRSAVMFLILFVATCVAAIWLSKKDLLDADHTAARGAFERAAATLAAAEGRLAKATQTVWEKQRCLERIAQDLAERERLAVHSTRALMAEARLWMAERASDLADVGVTTTVPSYTDIARQVGLPPLAATTGTVGAPELHEIHPRPEAPEAPAA